MSEAEMIRQLEDEIKSLQEENKTLKRKLSDLERNISTEQYAINLRLCQQVSRELQEKRNKKD